MKRKRPWMGCVLVPLLGTMLDEIEEAMDGLALGPLLGTMLYKAEGASDGLALGLLLGTKLDETEGTMDRHTLWPLLGTMLWVNGSDLLDKVGVKPRSTRGRIDRKEEGFGALMSIMAYGHGGIIGQVDGWVNGCWCR